MEDDQVNLDTLNETEDTTETVETEESPVETEESKPEPTESEKKLYARLKKTEAELKKLKSQPKDSSLTETTVDTSSLYEQVSLLKNIEQDEMESLEQDAKDLGVPVVKYLKSNAGKTRLDAIRKEKKSKDASPAIGASSPVYKKFTQADISKMSAAELAKILPHAE